MRTRSEADMASTIMVKVYGSICPASPALCAALQAIAQAAGAEGSIEHEGDLLRIAYEGIYFPTEDIVEALPRHLTEQSEGRIDHIDFDAWLLTRHIIQDCTITESSRDLNNVLDFSGH